MEEALKRLDMPVIMHKRKEIDMVLQEDPDIEGHDESNFIFTDISTSANDRVLFLLYLFTIDFFFLEQF